MVGGSVVRQATRNAVQAITMAVCAIAVIGAAVLLERLYYGWLRDEASQSSLRAAQAANELAEIDRAQQLAAALAAHSAEPQWRAQVMAYAPNFAAAMERIKAVASEPPRAAALRARIAARTAELESIYADVVAKSAAGRLSAAGAALAAPAFVDAAAARSRDLETLEALYAEDAATAAHAIDRGAIASLVAMIGALIIGVWAFYTRMRRGLERSQEAYLEADERIRDLAAVDALTGAMTRGALRELAESQCREARISGATVSLVVLDVDDFGALNRRLGYLQGDALLRRMAARLRDKLRTGETMARLEGDAFAVLMCDHHAQAPALHRAQELRRAAAGAYPLDAGEVTLNVTAGVASLSANVTDGESLLRAAVAATRHAKTHERHGVSSFSAPVMEALDERREVQAELRAGLARGEVFPVFQPIVTLDGHAPQGFELLARWRHPTRGLIAPNDFIPIAEEAGLIDVMMFSILEQAFVAAKDWPKDLRLSVNVAPRQLIAPGFTDRLLEAMVKAGWAPGRLQVEITESALLADFAAARRAIRALRAIGVDVALDDFGTGHSSLGYLAELPFAALKIDRAFVRTLHDCEASAKIVAAIAGLGRSLGVTIVAEGVETERDALALEDLGCTMAQGYHFARPMPAGQTGAYLAAAAQAGKRQRATA
jgi:diguanylate cyclase (GGDEF)-like protein